MTYDGETIPVPADKPTLNDLAQSTGGSFHTATSQQELESVYANIGSQIGYSTVHRDISWRFLRDRPAVRPRRGGYVDAVGRPPRLVQRRGSSTTGTQRACCLVEGQYWPAPAADWRVLLGTEVRSAGMTWKLHPAIKLAHARQS